MNKRKRIQLIFEKKKIICFVNQGNRKEMTVIVLNHKFVLIKIVKHSIKLLGRKF